MISTCWCSSRKECCVIWYFELLCQEKAEIRDWQWLDTLSSSYMLGAKLPVVIIYWDFLMNTVVTDCPFGRSDCLKCSTICTGQDKSVDNSKQASIVLVQCCVICVLPYSLGIKDISPEKALRQQSLGVSVKKHQPTKVTLKIGCKCMCAVHKWKCWVLHLSDCL